MAPESADWWIRGFIHRRLKGKTVHVQVTIIEVLFFVAIWIVAFCASITKAAYDSGPNTFVRLLTIGFSGGFLSLGIIAIWIDWVSHRSPDTANNSFGPWFWIGTSTLLGFFHKDVIEFLLLNSNKLLTTIVSKVFKLFGVEDKKD